MILCKNKIILENYMIMRYNVGHVTKKCQKFSKNAGLKPAK